jgi:hypothetical protein
MQAHDPSLISHTEEAENEAASLHTRLHTLEQRLAHTTATDLHRAEYRLELAHLQLEVQQYAQAWDNGMEAFQCYVAHEDWDGAVSACDVLFFAEHSDSLVALGHGLWLGVTYPIKPELTVAMLQHLIEETPADADGGAVAAATAHFIADIRAQGEQRASLLFFTHQLLGQVARRHSQVETQEQFEAWVTRLELDNPDIFIPRLGLIIDILVQDHWWIDRAALRARIPSA